MNVVDNTSEYVNTPGGGEIPPCTGLIPDALPEVQQQTTTLKNLPSGVSTRNALLPKDIQEARRAARTPHWYVLRCTYGRERKSVEYLETKNLTVYYPTDIRIKVIDGKRKKVEESFFPNLIFVFGLFNDLTTHVYDNVHEATKPLRFYYHRYNNGMKTVRVPLTITDRQMESIRRTCSSGSDDIIISPTVIRQFEKGQSVRVIEGKFKGVEGKVARYQGQQRVAIIVEGAFTVATAYVPSAFLEKMSED